jgi:hypothetical protein
MRISSKQSFRIPECPVYGFQLSGFTRRESESGWSLSSTLTSKARQYVGVNLQVHPNLSALKCRCT